MSRKNEILGLGSSPICMRGEPVAHVDDAEEEDHIL